MAKYRVTTKSRLYNGVTEGVQFTFGEAFVDDERVKDVLVVNYGYTVEEIEAKEPEAENPAAEKKSRTAKK